MKRQIGLWQFIGFGVTSFGGTLLHFLYEWLGEAKWIAPFSGVNESTWEHMKLLFWPTFIFAVVQSFFFRDRKDFWCVKLRGILLGIVLIPIIFYTYNGAVGKSPDWLNIAIFFLSAAITYITRRTSSDRKRSPVALKKRLSPLFACLVYSLYSLPSKLPRSVFSEIL